MTQASTGSTASPVADLSPARKIGRIVGGFFLGLMLLPAVLELLSLVGDISPFRYQGF